MRKPYYHLEDIAWLIEDAPYFEVGRLPFLKKMERLGRSFSEELSLYPAALCEPLEAHYLSLRGLGALDEHLVKDLVLELSWREAAWGAWLVALSPKPEYREPLIARRPHVPHQHYIVDLALASVDGDFQPHLREAMEYLGNIRSSLAAIPRPIVPLRRSPTDQEARQMKQEQAYILGAYRRGGVTAARACLPGSLWGYYGLDYKTWRARGQPNVQQWLPAGEPAARS